MLAINRRNSSSSIFQSSSRLRFASSWSLLNSLLSSLRSWNLLDSISALCSRCLRRFCAWFLVITCHSPGADFFSFFCWPSSVDLWERELDETFRKSETETSMVILSSFRRVNCTEQGRVVIPMRCWTLTAGRCRSGRYPVSWWSHLPFLTIIIQVR